MNNRINTSVLTSLVTDVLNHCGIEPFRVESHTEPLELKVITYAAVKFEQHFNVEKALKHNLELK